MNAIIRFVRARRAAARRVARLLLAGAFAVGLAAPALAEPPLEKTEIRYQGWAGQVTFTELAEDLGASRKFPKALASDQRSSESALSWMSTSARSSLR